MVSFILSTSALSPEKEPSPHGTHCVRDLAYLRDGLDVIGKGISWSCM
jgi:hypothetical protein